MCCEAILLVIPFLKSFLLLIGINPWSQRAVCSLRLPLSCRAVPASCSCSPSTSALRLIPARRVVPTFQACRNAAPRTPSLLLAPPTYSLRCVALAATPLLLVVPTCPAVHSAASVASRASKRNSSRTSRSSVSRPPSR
jgi:hypothetical protein